MAPQEAVEEALLAQVVGVALDEQARAAVAAQAHVAVAEAAADALLPLRHLVAVWRFVLFPKV